MLCCLQANKGGPCSLIEETDCKDVAGIQCDECTHGGRCCSPCTGIMSHREVVLSGSGELPRGGGICGGS